MTPPIPPALLEHAASTSGFDLHHPRDAGWSAFASSQTLLRVWLRSLDGGGAVVALSMGNVDEALAVEGYGSASSETLPAGALAAREVGDRSRLHALLRRAWQLSRVLPDEILHEFERRTATMPRSTEVERLVVQRVGQDLFRERLLEHWEGRCALTGLAVPALLRASHIKPWSECETDGERLDVFNGLLLAPHLDAVFDLGFVTFLDDGALSVSELLDASSLDALGIAPSLRLSRLDDRHRGYLRFHRARVFRRRERG